MLFLLFWGPRGFTATDWKTYYPFFLGQLEIDYEKGFSFLTYLIRCLTDSWVYYQFILMIISVVILQYLFVKYSPYISLSWFIWISHFLGYHDLMRFSIAILIVYASFKYIYHKNMVKYFLYVLLGATFHISVILFLPLYFLINRQYSTKLYYYLLVFCIFSFLLKLDILYFFLPYLELFTDKAATYTEGRFLNSSMNTSIKAMIPLTLFYIYGTVYYNKLIYINKNMCLFFNLYVIFFIIRCTFNDNGELQRRLSYLFEPSWCFLLPIYLQNTLPIPRKLILILIVVYGLRQCNLYNNIMWKYENYLFTNVTSYHDRDEEISIVSATISTAAP